MSKAGHTGAEPVRNKMVWIARAGAPANAYRQLPTMMRAYFAQVREMLAADPHPAELHAVRLATKRVRYTLELFRGCYGRGLGARLAALQRLQQLLGEVNDCVAAGRLIQSSIGDSAARPQVESYLRRRAAAKAAALRREWNDIFDAPGREQWWLRYLATAGKVRNPGL